MFLLLPHLYLSSIYTSLPPVGQFLLNWLPSGLAVRLNRWKAVLLGAVFYQYCIRYPEHAKKLIKGGMYKEVEGVMSREEFEKHFNPPYNPWEQRFCLAPGGDFFEPIRFHPHGFGLVICLCLEPGHGLAPVYDLGFGLHDCWDHHHHPSIHPSQTVPICINNTFISTIIRQGKASMVTGHIDHLTEKGIQMKDGQHVDADFIISATGLTMQPNFPFSTMKVFIDGKEYNAPDHLVYNGIMISDVPNFAFIMGYTNASWTLKADIVSLYFSKLLNYMRDSKVARVMPKENPEDKVVKENVTGGLTSGYFARSASVLPKQGTTFPWKGGVNYLMDLVRIAFHNLP